MPAVAYVASPTVFSPRSNAKEHSALLLLGAKGALLLHGLLLLLAQLLVDLGALGGLVRVHHGLKTQRGVVSGQLNYDWEDGDKVTHGLRGVLLRLGGFDALLGLRLVLTLRLAAELVGDGALVLCRGCVSGCRRAWRRLGWEAYWSRWPCGSWAARRGTCHRPGSRSSCSFSMWSCERCVSFYPACSQKGVPGRRPRRRRSGRRKMRRSFWWYLECGGGGSCGSD